MWSTWNVPLRPEQCTEGGCSAHGQGQGAASRTPPLGTPGPVVGQAGDPPFWQSLCGGAFVAGAGPGRMTHGADSPLGRQRNHLMGGRVTGKLSPWDSLCGRGT